MIDCQSTLNFHYFDFSYLQNISSNTYKPTVFSFVQYIVSSRAFKKCLPKKSCARCTIVTTHYSKKHNSIVYLYEIQYFFRSAKMFTYSFRCCRQNNPNQEKHSYKIIRSQVFNKRKRNVYIIIPW